MFPNGSPDDVIFLRGRNKILDMAFLKKNMDAVFRMIHGTIIEKCLVAPQLFKAANIMKDANEPGQINVLFFHGKALGNPFRKRCHAQGMGIFEVHPRPNAAKSIHIGFKGIQDVFS